jgi:hypothetical protein
MFGGYWTLLIYLLDKFSSPVYFSFSQMAFLVLFYRLDLLVHVWWVLIIFIWISGYLAFVQNFWKFTDDFSFYLPIE